MQSLLLDNVGDLGTKPLKADRIAKLLGMCGVRDSEDGYQLLGRVHLLEAEDRSRIRRIVRRGSLSHQRVLQILASALQVGSVSGQPSNASESNAADADTLSQPGESFLGFLEQIFRVFLDVCEMGPELAQLYPVASLLLIQVLAIVLACVLSNCWRPRVQTLREGADKGIDVTVNITMPSADVGVTPKARSVAVSSAHSSGYPKSKANPKPLAKSATRSLQAAETERDPTAGPSSGPSSGPASVQPATCSCA